MTISHHEKLTSAGSWPTSWDRLEMPADRMQAHLFVGQAVQRTPLMIEAIRRRRETGGLRRAKRLSRRFLMSDTPRLAAAAAAYEKRIGGLVDDDGRALEAVFAALPEVNPFRPSKGRLIAFPREKLDGSFRQVFRAPFVTHAVGLLTKYALEGMVAPEPTQFMSSGGRAGFERWLRRELPGAALVLTTDIPRCFESVLREAIDADLPLPAAVKKEVLFEPKDRALFLDVTPRGLTPMEKENVAVVSAPKRGIPQGTAPASIVSEAMIGPIIEALASTSPDVRAASFGDNLIVILRNAGDRALVIETLTSAVRVRFGDDAIGPLTHRTCITSPRAGFSFCGRDYQLSKGKVRARLSPLRLGKFEVRMAVRMQDAQRSRDPAQFDAVRRSIVGWVVQNAGLSGAVMTAVEMLVQLEHFRRKDSRSEPPTDPVDASTLGELIEPQEVDPPLVESL